MVTGVAALTGGEVLEAFVVLAIAFGGYNLLTGAAHLIRGLGQFREAVSTAATKTTLGDNIQRLFFGILPRWAADLAGLP